VKVRVSSSATVKLSNLCTSEEALKVRNTIVKKKNTDTTPNMRMQFQRKVHINPTAQ
jgi:hypothetical protein